MKLQPSHFELMKSGKKDIEIRLYDEKRRKLNKGDTITFQLDANPTEQVSVKIIELLRYNSFAELLDAINSEHLGGVATDDILKDLHTFYSSEDEKRYGVVGIRFQKLS